MAGAELRAGLGRTSLRLQLCGISPHCNLLQLPALQAAVVPGWPQGPGEGADAEGVMFWK